MITVNVFIIIITKLIHLVIIGVDLAKLLIINYLQQFIIMVIVKLIIRNYVLEFMFLTMLTNLKI